MTDYIISAGQVSAGLSLSAGDSLTVLSGGTVIGTQNDNALDVISSGGVASFTALSGGGGLEYVSSGGIAYATDILSGSNEFVFTGATAISATVNSGQQIVSSGGIASATTVDSNGVLYDQGGTTFNATASGGAIVTERDQADSNSGTSISSFVTDDGLELLGPNGFTTGTVLSNGGVEQALGGGITSDTVVFSGGTEVVAPGYGISSGGIAISVTLLSGGTELVSGGGTAIAATVSSGGSDFILSGGIASNTSLTGWELVSAGGTAVSTDVIDGGNQFVFASGVAIATTVDDGQQILSSGGTAIGALVNADGVQYNQGGTSFNATVNGGYQVTETDGATGTSGTSINTYVTDSGVELVATNGFTSGTRVISGGVEQVLTSGVSSDTQVFAGGTELVAAGYTKGAGTSISAAVASGGTEIVGSGGLASGTMLQGGTLVLQSGAAVSGSESFGAGTSGGLLLDEEAETGGATLNGTTVSGWDPASNADDQLDFRSISFVSGTTMTVAAWVGTFVENSITYSVNLAGTPDGTYGAYNDGDGGTEFCFAAGTRIATPAGPVAVERIAAGDAVLTAGGAARPVVWAGRRTIDFSRHPRPENAWPVRIAAGALGERVPLRDLYVSPDHALLLEGVLIPAKVLVNGTSIRQVPVARIAYFHIELATHDVLLAEAAPAESYLDTVNRDWFADRNGLMLLRPEMTLDRRQARREAESCAPLREAGAAVRAARQKILARVPAVPTTLDPALAAFAGPWPLRVERVDEVSYRITLPARPAALRLLSRHDVPAEQSADPDDRRRLGVAVRSLALNAGPPLRREDPALRQGWYRDEGTHRWTDGAAVIPAELLRGARWLTVRTGGGFAYRLLDSAASAVAAA
jgi:autotransporter passenger strand-loop-strand repeat protein